MSEQPRRIVSILALLALGYYQARPDDWPFLGRAPPQFAWDHAASLVRRRSRSKLTPIGLRLERLQPGDLSPRLPAALRCGECSRHGSAVLLEAFGKCRG